jgi:hypothetical protein
MIYGPKPAICRRRVSPEASHFPTRIRPWSGIRARFFTLSHCTSLCSRLSQTVRRERVSHRDPLYPPYFYPPTGNRMSPHRGTITSGNVPRKRLHFVEPVPGEWARRFIVGSPHDLWTRSPAGLCRPGAKEPGHRLRETVFFREWVSFSPATTG